MGVGKRASAPAEALSAGAAKKRKPTAAPEDGGAPASWIEHTDTEAAYLSWMRARGVVLRGVTIGRFPRTGRGCVATRDLAPGDVIVEVPDDCVITAATSVAANALRELITDEADEPVPPRLEREALVLAVAAEMSLGAESAFAPYLAALPTLRATHSPLGWSGAELAELQGTTALARMTDVEDERAELPSMTAQHWKHVARPFFEANPAFARAGGGAAASEKTLEEEASEASEASDEETNARRLYLHATALVAAFSFTLGEPDDDDANDSEDSFEAPSDSELCHREQHATTQAMVPFWDMLNHREPAAACVRLDHDEASRSLRMIATRAVREGEEVFNTYGALGDEELLRRYGFVMRRNPHGGGAEVDARELLAAARVAAVSADLEEEGDEGDASESEESEEEEEESEEESEKDSSEDSSDSDASDASDDGSETHASTLARLRLLRRWGVLLTSASRFSVSRTGAPSVALKAAARVLSMSPFRFRELLAADAYARGDRDDQTGAYSDEEDEEEKEEKEDAFAGARPRSVEEVWNAADKDEDEGTRRPRRTFRRTRGSARRPRGSRRFSLPRPPPRPFRATRSAKRVPPRTRAPRTRPASTRAARRVITIPLWDLLGTEKSRRRETKARERSRNTLTATATTRSRAPRLFGTPSPHPLTPHASADRSSPPPFSPPFLQTLPSRPTPPGFRNPFARTNRSASRRRSSRSRRLRSAASPAAPASPRTASG